MLGFYVVMLKIEWLKPISNPFEFTCKLRVVLLCGILAAMHYPFHILAGHDVMVHLAIYNDGPFKTDAVPAVFGVPLPSSDDPVDPQDLILVGAKTWQIKPLSHWPNGSIRWMLVEAIVEVQPNQDRAAYHLTTGEAPKEQPLIATEIANGFQMDTGMCLIQITGTDPVVCQMITQENNSPTDFSVLLTQNENNLGELQDRTVVLENNGPVTATVSLIETYIYQEFSKITFKRRCQAFKDRQGFTIESTIYRHPGGLQSIPLKYPTLTSSPKEAEEVQITAQGMPEENSDEAFELVPGSMKRVWHTVNLKPSEVSSTPLRPYLGRAISINTYNDAFCTEAYVTAGNGNASLDLNDQVFSRSRAAQFIRDVMGGNLLPAPSNFQTLSEWLENWIPEIETSQLSGTHDEEISMDSMNSDDSWRIPSLWFFMTGDSIFKDLRLNDVRNQSVGGYDLRHFHRLWDAYLLNGSLEIRDSIATKMSDWFIDSARNVETGRRNRHLYRMAANLIHQGGFKPEDHDKWLDGLETFVHQPSEINDLMFAEGFLLTGENKFLKEGKLWLEQTFEVSPKNDAITGLIQNIQRQHVWRWLEPTVTDRGDEGLELSWKAPDNAVRYRFKHSDRKITNLPLKGNSTSTIPFYAAENLEADIAPAAPGTLQTIKVDKSKTGNNSFFAMRYLERGPGLPALKSSPVQTNPTQSPNPTNSTTPKTYAEFILIGMMIIALGAALLFWKKNI